MAQTAPLPYREIPDYPTGFAPGNLLSRMIDGLGYRYYWATEGLEATDLAYTPEGEGCRSSLETLQHIHGLSSTIWQTALGKNSRRPAPVTTDSFEVLRRETLIRLKEASEAFSGKSEAALENMQLVFQKGKEEYPYPLWHLLNGQLSDALYHLGQVVSFRRSSGNPIHPGVSVFMGKTRE